MASETFFCPHCGALLGKDPKDLAYAQAAGFIVIGNTTETCPGCGKSIDRMSIIQGKYDQKKEGFFQKLFGR